MPTDNLIQTPAVPKKKPWLPAIEYIRGIAMMAVIAIHVGSQYLSNPSANIHLVMLMEITTRFCVPIFFFISAFGLFYHLDINAKFDYGKFMKKRFKTVLIPYLAWSVFYLAHDGLLFHTGFPDLPHFLVILFFGLAKYQLYFLVIMLWFYILMPLWIWMVKRMGIISLTVLFIAQVAFDYWSSFSVPFNMYVYGLPEDSILRAFLMNRLNYWVMHYMFIFVLGGYLSVHFDRFKVFMQQHRTLITAFFWATMLWLIGFYYKLIYVDGYTALEAINTAHQLCPAGVFYTLASSLFFFTIFTYQKYPQFLNPIMHVLGKHSYFAYLVHPIAITYLSGLMKITGHIITAPLCILFYCIVLGFAIATAAICRRLGNSFPIINELTIGAYPKKKR